MNVTQGTMVRYEDLVKEKQELIGSDPELKKHDDEWEQEYQIRKMMRTAREETGINQTVLGMMSGLDHRAISLVETNADVSPNLKTIVKYLNAIGYRLEVVKAKTD